MSFSGLFFLLKSLGIKSNINNKRIAGLHSSFSIHFLWRLKKSFDIVELLIVVFSNKQSKKAYRILGSESLNTTILSLFSL